MDPFDNNSAITLYDFDNPINQAEEEGEKDCEFLKEIARMLEQEEKVIQPHQEEIEKVNLGNADMISEVKIGAALGDSVKQRLIELLREYSDIFAWSYEDMPGLDT